MESVKLSDFIESTLVEIATGIEGANQKMREIQHNQKGCFCLRRNIGDSSKISGVNFDVAITAGKKDKEGVGFMVALLNLGGGAQIEKSKTAELAHRIKFEVGIADGFS